MPLTEALELAGDLITVLETKSHMDLRSIVVHENYTRPPPVPVPVPAYAAAEVEVCNFCVRSQTVNN